MPSRRLWVKRRRTPRWAILLSWIMGAVVWLWIVYRFIVQDLLESVLDSLAEKRPGQAELFFNGLFFVVAATALAAFAMLIVRLIGRAWLKLRSYRRI